MPPSYRYHLKFELYPSPNPTLPLDRDRASDDIWVPTPASDIFGVLPAHPPRSATASDDATFTPRRPGTKSSPAPSFEAGIGPRTAVRDWRFAKISIESFDCVPQGLMEQNMATGGGVEKGAPATSLGPSLGGMGQATKGRFLPLGNRNTEAGWGIVHLYREDGKSSAAPEGVVDEASGSVEENDGTVLCIPAVPNYLTPGDFLGWVGEKWMGDVSHYRMVMTSRWSRYMVLMKFRDSGHARDWQKEFNGKLFNQMEVRDVHFLWGMSGVFADTSGGTSPRRAMSP
jgi:BRCA1-associated protein